MATSAGKKGKRNPGKLLALERNSRQQRGDENLCVPTSKPSDEGFSVSEHTSPNSSLHNLTVTYQYAQSPITCSTRSLSELSSILPSDGAPLRSQQLLIRPSCSSPLSSSHQHPTTPVALSSHRRVRKRLKIDSGSKSKDVQRLLNIASQVSTAKNNIKESIHTPPGTQEVTCIQADTTTRDTSSDKYNKFDSLPHEQVSESCDDEEFWSQAVEVLDTNKWEDEDSSTDADSAFIDEILSSGLVNTPQLHAQGHHSTLDASKKTLNTPPHPVQSSVSPSSHLSTHTVNLHSSI